MMPRNRPPLRLLMLIAPVLLLSACASKSPVSVPPAEIPPLPAEARVSQVPTPSICSSGCSAGWTRLVETSVDSLTGSK